MTLKTIRVVSPVSDDNPHGYIVINEHDMTADHVPFSPESEKVAGKPVRKAPAQKARP